MNDVWTVQRILTWTTNFFTSQKLPDARLSAELLLARVLDCRRVDLYLQFERILTTEERESYRGFVKRRAEHEPVQYILQETEFMGVPFRVSPAVLIPRPETELLVDFILEDFRGAGPVKILDVGTGSGCIAVSLAKLLPESRVWAVDKSAEALAIARKNARALEAEVEFIEQDIFEDQATLPADFQVVVSNPPYVSEQDWAHLEPEVARYEPRMALYGGGDGLDFYRRFTGRIDNLLASEGRVYLETGYNQAEDVAEMLRQHNYQTEIKADLNRIHRFVIARRGQVQ